MGCRASILRCGISRARLRASPSRSCWAGRDENHYRRTPASCDTPIRSWLRATPQRRSTAATRQSSCTRPASSKCGPGLLATVHVAAALEQETMIEYSYCELGASPLGDAIAVANGRIAVPHAPGLGRDPDPWVLAHYQVAK